MQEVRSRESSWRSEEVPTAGCRGEERHQAAANAEPLREKRSCSACRGKGKDGRPHKFMGMSRKPRVPSWKLFFFSEDNEQGGTGV